MVTPHPPVYISKKCTGLNCSHLQHLKPEAWVNHALCTLQYMRQSTLIYTQWELRCTSMLVHLSSTCVMLHSPTHSHTHTQTAERLFTIFSMHRCTQAQKQKLTAEYTNTLCSQMSSTNRLQSGRCSDAETGAIYRAACSLPGNYHIKFIHPMVLTSPRPNH